MSRDLSVTNQNQNKDISIPNDFKGMMEFATFLSKSSIIPKDFQDNAANCFIALQMAQRMDMPALTIFQNLFVIMGKPCLSSPFLISRVNSHPDYTNIKYNITGDGLKMEGYAYVTQKSTNEVIKGPVVSMKMAQDEGWYGKQGSKWKTMPDLMLRYRCASFLVRTCLPDVLFGGLYTVEEVVDGVRNVTPQNNPIDYDDDYLKQDTVAAQKIEEDIARLNQSKKEIKKFLNDPEVQKSPHYKQIIGAILNMDSIDVNHELIDIINELSSLDKNNQIGRIKCCLNMYMIYPIVRDDYQLIAECESAYNSNDLKVVREQVGKCYMFVGGNN